QKGFILGFLDIIGWLGSLVLTFMYYPYAARWLEQFLAPQSVWTIPLAFILTFLVFRIMAGIIINFILGALPAEAHTNFINRFFGLAPGLINGLIYAAIAATLLLIVPVSDKVS